MLFLSYVQLIKNGCNLCILVFTQIFDNERRLPGTNFFVFPVHRFFPVHTMSNVLIIEDDPDISHVIELVLTGDGHNCRVANNGTKGLQEIKLKEPDIITLDVMLGEDETGMDYCKKIRHEYAQSIGILMITAKGGGYNEAMGFDSGCDCYIEKPFDPELLKVKVRNLGNRIKRIRNEVMRSLSGEKETEGSCKTILESSHLILDLARNKVQARGVSTEKKDKELDLTEFELTEMEMRVLAFLMQKEETLTRRQIMSGVWGTTQYVDERTVDKQVWAIRAKINKVFGRKMEIIITKHGSGYRFVD